MLSSPFKDLRDIEYFKFEEDFIEKNVRCIPMIVRFKMDAAGIKLKLAEWSRFSIGERIELALKACGNETEVALYKNHLASLVKKYTGKSATVMEVDKNPLWSITGTVPVMIEEKAMESGYDIWVSQWKSLTDLQRFALLKLCREGHENKNFPKAIMEFGFVNKRETSESRIIH